MESALPAADTSDDAISPTDALSLQFTNKFWTQRSIRKTRLYSEYLNYTRPEGLNLVPLDADRASIMMARLHNGIRREFMDLYNIIDSMQRRVHDLRSAELELFFQWWDLFSSFLEASFMSHEHVLVPWLQKKTSMPPFLNDSTRNEMRRIVQTFLQKFETTYSQLTRRPPDETLAKIIQSLDDVHAIIEYLETFEKHIPAVIEEHFKPNDIKQIERKVAVYLHKHGDSDFRRLHLSVIARAMTEEQLPAWKKSLPLIIRFSYRSHSKKFDTTHTEAAQKLAEE